MAYSFLEYDQCYRENVTALGGKVTKVDYTSGAPSDTVDETDVSEETEETE